MITSIHNVVVLRSGPMNCSNVVREDVHYVTGYDVVAGLGENGVRMLVYFYVWMCITAHGAVITGDLQTG